ncbi:MAG: DUF1080 domain-containing protein [Bryobacteraceae bacterium]|nr:DUF1080 domain-containing protein [Bryobacteraceae bacterium]
MKTIALMLLASLACSAENTLTPEEKRAGWQLLFDGTSLKGWKDPAQKNVPNRAWVVDNGTLKTVTSGEGKKFSEDLIHERQFKDFNLRFDWKLLPGGNTGLKYRIQREIFMDEQKAGPGRFEEMMGRETAQHVSDRTKYSGGQAQVYTVGFEFQLLDDEGHPDGKRNASHRTGALYSFIPAAKTAANPPGQWNSSELVVKGDHFEHWLNGDKVLEGSLRDPAVKAGAEKRWAPAPVIRDLLTNPKPVGSLALQHHGDEVWFRNLRVLEMN